MQLCVDMNSVQASQFVNVGSAPAFGNSMQGAIVGSGAGVDGGNILRDGMGQANTGYVTTAMGMQMMHPGSMMTVPHFFTPQPTEDPPYFVNAKQYHRIIIRREARKKRYGSDDMNTGRSRRKAYIHESRHKHAMNRKRGEGGRFLKRNELAAKAKAEAEEKLLNRGHS